MHSYLMTFLPPSPPPPTHTQMEFPRLSKDRGQQDPQATTNIEDLGLKWILSSFCPSRHITYVLTKIYQMRLLSIGTAMPTSSKYHYNRHKITSHAHAPRHTTLIIIHTTQYKTSSIMTLLLLIKYMTLIEAIMW